MSFSRTQGNVHTLWIMREKLAKRPFTWDMGVTAEQATVAADEILRRPADKQQRMAILCGKTGEKY